MSSSSEIGSSDTEINSLNSFTDFEDCFLTNTRSFREKLVFRAVKFSVELSIVQSNYGGTFSMGVGRDFEKWSN
jgi:hypothetical protein